MPPSQLPGAGESEAGESYAVGGVLKRYPKRSHPGVGLHICAEGGVGAHLVEEDGVSAVFS